MPRQLRLEYAGAIYHLMNRGDRREVIVKDGGIGSAFSQPSEKHAKRRAGRCTPFA
jgi:hypothetical protein